MQSKLAPLWMRHCLPLMLAVLICCSGSRSFADDQPTIVKDSIQVMAFTFNVYKKSIDTWSWVPRLVFRVNGPVPSGSQLYAEFSLPDGSPWVKFDCKTEDTQEGHTLKTEGGARDIPEDKGSLQTGTVNFAIKMRNELNGSDTTLFKGRAKVLKAHSNEGGPKVANHFVYYIDQDWNLPIAYVFFSGEKKKPMFNAAFWVRGDADTASFQPHLFHDGKEVGKMFFEGKEVGKAGAKPEIEDVTTHFVADSVPQKAKWARVV
ncbi:MAG TPA: hypothetical protein V6C72_01185, partial [Chroococcales cyanobacterium]